MLFARCAGAVYRAEQVYERHAALVAVLRTGEAGAIERAIREHYVSSAHRFAAFLDRGAEQPGRLGQDQQPRSGPHTPA